MRAYLVEGGQKKKYCGTQAEVTATKKSLMKDDGLKRKDISVSEVDIPDDKKGKLDFINNVLNGILKE